MVETPVLSISLLLACPTNKIAQLNNLELLVGRGWNESKTFHMGAPYMGFTIIFPLDTNQISRLRIVLNTMNEFTWDHLLQ